MGKKKTATRAYIDALREDIAALFEGEGIRYVAPLPAASLRIWNENKLGRLGFTAETLGSALIFLVPYKPDGDSVKRNISVYAAARDYHIYFRDLFARICPKLEALYPGHRFAGSADNAPIDERHAASVAGLGFVGDSGLLINEAYGTYTFIGEIFTDLPHTSFYRTQGAQCAPTQPTECTHCGRCKTACPMQDNPFGISECLSFVTQTKRLSALCTPENDRCEADYINYIRRFGSAWGCDICQSVCPHNAGALPTSIPFFLTDLTPYLTYDAVLAMDDGAFSERAYAWRGKATVLRNLEILEK